MAHWWREQASVASDRGQALIIIPAHLAGGIVLRPLGVALFNHAERIFDHLLRFLLTMLLEFVGGDVVLTKAASSFGGSPSP